MMFDAVLCFHLPSLARWTAVVVDRWDGEEYPVESVRFRWRRSAETWVERATTKYVKRGMTVTFAVRPLRSAP